MKDEAFERDEAKRRKAHYGKGTVLSNLKHFITFELMSLMKT